MNLIFRSAPATAHDAPSKQTRRLSEAELSRAWPKLVAREREKKNFDREPREMNRVAQRTDVEFDLNCRRREALQFIAAREETGTMDLMRFNRITDSQARHDADKLTNVGFITATKRGRRMVYQITAAGNVWLETAEAGAPIKKQEDATQ